MVEPLRITDHSLHVQAMVGYGDGGVSAVNGSAKLTHVPVELLAFYYHRPTGLRVGWGPR